MYKSVAGLERDRKCQICCRECGERDYGIGGRRNVQDVFLGRVLGEEEGELAVSGFLFHFRSAGAIGWSLAFLFGNSMKASWYLAVLLQTQSFGQV